MATSMISSVRARAGRLLAAPTTTVAPPRVPASTSAARAQQARALRRAEGLARWRDERHDELAQLAATAWTRVARGQDQPQLRLVDHERRAIDRRLRELDDLASAGFCPERPTVVVADERPPDRVLLLHALRRDGRLEVLGDALDGAEAVALAVVDQPDVLLVHEQLPGRSAEEVITSVSRLAPRTRCVVVKRDDLDRTALVERAVRAARQV